MSKVLPPIPPDKIEENFKWRDWFRALATYVNTNPNGVSGTFTTADSKTVTVTNGIITSIQ